MGRRIAVAANNTINHIQSSDPLPLLFALPPPVLRTVTEVEATAVFTPSATVSVNCSTWSAPTVGAVNVADAEVAFARFTAVPDVWVHW